MRINKYDIFLVDLDLTRGSEQKGVHPCVVVQNNQANKWSRTTVVCPFTSTIRSLPHFLAVEPSDVNKLDRECAIDLLQIKTVDKTRLIKKLGFLDSCYIPEFTERFKTSFDLEDLFLNFS